MLNADLIIRWLRVASPQESLQVFDAVTERLVHVGVPTDVYVGSSEPLDSHPTISVHSAVRAIQNAKANDAAALIAIEAAAERAQVTWVDDDVECSSDSSSSSISTSSLSVSTDESSISTSSISTSSSSLSESSISTSSESSSSTSDKTSSQTTPCVDGPACWDCFGGTEILCPDNYKVRVQGVRDTAFNATLLAFIANIQGRVLDLAPGASNCFWVATDGFVATYEITVQVRNKLVWAEILIYDVPNVGNIVSAEFQLDCVNAIHCDKRYDLSFLVAHADNDPAVDFSGATIEFNPTKPLGNCGLV